MSCQSAHPHEHIAVNAATDRFGADDTKAFDLELIELRPRILEGHAKMKRLNMVGDTATFAA